MHGWESERIKWYDYFFVITLCIIDGILILCEQFDWMSNKNLKLGIHLLNFFLPIILFISYYVRLRINRIFITWLILGIVHGIIMKLFFDELFQFGRVKAYLPFNILTALGILFILRLISAYVFGQELIIASRYSIDEHRNPNIWDHLLTLLGITALMVLLLLND